jgi:DNA-binding response OmpR family regulator
LLKPRVLLVDANVAVLLTLKAVLELHKFSVDVAASAAEALRKLESATYDLVITETHLEAEKAGLKVIRAARLQPYNPATALLTADLPADGSWKTNGTESLLIKPLGTAELLSQIRTLLARHRGGQVLSAGRRGLQARMGSMNRGVVRKAS